MNVPLVCAKQLLLPADVQIVLTLRQSYPTLYKESPQEEEEEKEEVCFEQYNTSFADASSCTGELYVGVVARGVVRWLGVWSGS